MHHCNHLIEMRKLKLYLETSVWNFCFADDAPEKRDSTIQFFDLVREGRYDIFISRIVFDEIDRASEEEQLLLTGLIASYQPKELELNEEVLKLADKYLREGALPKRAADDAKHVAVATFFSMDALITWNLKHLANLKRIRLINIVNMKEGFSDRIALLTPMEVSYE